MKESLERRKNLDTALEQLPIPDHDRANVLLAAFGKKPTSTLSVRLYERGGDRGPVLYSPEESEQRVRRVEQQIHALELHTKRGALDSLGHTPSEWPEQNLMYGRSSEDVERIAVAFKNDSPEMIREEGRLFGFPLTAIDAYVRAKAEHVDTTKTNPYLLITSEIPKELRLQDYYRFANFRLSKAHWQEEVETARVWAETVRTHAPKLYERILAQKGGGH